MALKKLNRFSFTYLYYWVVRQSGSPESVAMGVAIGLFVGFLVPFGGQIIVAGALAYLLKARMIPALAFTWVTNHFTVPIFYPLLCYFGSAVMGSPLSLSKIKEVFGNFLNEPSFSSFINLGQEFLISFLVGGFIVGIITGFIGYFATLGIFEHHARRKKLRLNKKLSKSSHRLSTQQKTEKVYHK